MKTPTCRSCKSTTIISDAGMVKSIPFFYCPKCKLEVNSEGYDVQLEKEPADISLTNLNDDFIDGFDGCFWNTFSKILSSEDDLDFLDHG